MKYSFKRQSEFKEFQEFVNSKAHKILRSCQTRWLSLLSTVKRVLQQYDALKLYFRSQYLIDKIQQSEAIHNRLEDSINKCYLEFMEFILPFIININFKFQS